MDRDAGARDMTASVHSKCPANLDDPPNRATVMILGRLTETFHALGPICLHNFVIVTGRKTQLLLLLIQQLSYKYIDPRYFALEVCI